MQDCGAAVSDEGSPYYNMVAVTAKAVVTSATAGMCYFCENKTPTALFDLRVAQSNGPTDVSGT